MKYNIRLSIHILGFLSGLFLVSVVEAHEVSKNLPYPSGNPDADEIARQVYFVNRFLAFSNASLEKHPRGVAQVINRKLGKKPTFLTVERHINNIFSEGPIRSREMVIFRSGKMKGSAILITEYEDESRNPEYTIWLPALRRMRTIIENDQEKSWGGTVFTHGEMFLRKPSDETHTLAGVSRFDRCLNSLPLQQEEIPRGMTTDIQHVCDHKGKKVYILISKPKDDGNWYDYRVSFIDAETFADYRIEYHKDGKKIKLIDKDWRPATLPDKRAQLWHHIYGKNIATGFETYISVPKVALAVNTDKQPGFWTTETLKKIKLE